ncbi:MAG: hypothetical protein FGM15_09875 [Chthoniobacterales bacterium]|nr:hypothetical protein [Chthoniobacterales bacterium]
MSDESFSPQFGSPFQVVVDHCEEAGIKFRAEPDVKGVFFSMRGEMAIYDVALLVTHDDQVFQIYLTIPIATTEERLRPLVAEFVTRANHRIVIGHFDYDMDEGRLRYHIGHPFGERGLDDETVGRLFATAMGTADRYFPALMRALVGGETPADAVYLAELDYHAEAAHEEDRETAHQSSKEAPQPPKPSLNKRNRRPRKDPRLKSTRELPGLFERPKEERGPESKGNPPAS